MGSSDEIMPHRRNTPTPDKGTPKQTRLRRKVPVEDALVQGTSSRRLVEYFVVISSQPRWERKSARNLNSASPNPRKKKQASPQPKKKKELPKQSARWFARKASYGSSSNSEKRDERDPKPEPAPESPRQPSPSKQEQQPATGNIHMPQTADGCEYTFQPKITARYPSTEYPDHALNPMLVQFCYPHSDVIVPSTTYIMPRIHHFVLTNDKGRKVYGTCLTVYEEYYPSLDDPFRRNETVHSDSGELDIEVTVENGGRKPLYIPRVLCILSTWPYLTAFREYVTQLYRLATTTNMMDTPIERHILNLCEEIPAPPPGAFEIQVPILTSTIRFWAPPAKLPIPYVALPYQTLFDCLDVDNVLTVWYALVLERSVLLLSSQYSILTVCAEILTSLLFPMQWSHLYIPLIPRFLSPMLDAPFPYLCGVTGDNWIHAREFVSEQTILVNLDNNTVTLGVKSPAAPPVPTKKWEKLREALKLSAGEVFWETRGLADAHQQVQNQKMRQGQFDRLKKQEGEPRWKEKLQGFDDAFNLAYTPDSPNLLNDTSRQEQQQQQSQWDKVQEAFLRFFVSTVKGYRRFLEMPENADPESPRDKSARWCLQRTFDRDGFIASQKLEYQPFIKELCMTQQFDDFITKRLYSPGEPDVIFFDQSIDAKNNRSRLKLKKVDTPFLQGAQAHKILSVVTAVAPNAQGLPVSPESPVAVETSIDHKKPIVRETSEYRRAYMYKTWPEKFDPTLFGTARPIPNIITAEFDRQSALVSRLRANHVDQGADESSNNLMDFYGGDFDPSPEVATFTVFFFAYSAVIGREWQEYQKKRREIELGVFDIDEGAEIQDEPPANKEEEKDAVEAQLVEDMTDVTSSLLDCSINDCDICPNHRDTGIYQKEFLARFSVSQVSQSHSGTFLPEASLLDFDAGLAEFEEAKEVAAAQLDLAFSVLTTMNLRGIPTDPDAFTSLMEACGRCGDTDRALLLMEKMKKDGLVTDGEVYSALMKAFAEGDGSDNISSPSSVEVGHKRHQSDAYVSFLKKKVLFSGGPGETQSPTSVLTSSDEGETDTSAFSSESDGDKRPSFVSDYLYSSIWGTRTPRVDSTKKKNKRRRRRSSMSSSKILNTIVTDGVRKQIDLGRKPFGSCCIPICLLTRTVTPVRYAPSSSRRMILWPGGSRASSRTSQLNVLSASIVSSRDFSVKCSAPTFEGSQGPSTPLYCEMLSPWVLRKELENVVHGADGIQGMLDPEWRSGTDIRATLWWNLIVSFDRYRLPVSFLLQGSFQNRLINPTPDA